LLNSATRKVLARSRIAVVGQSGGGSHVVQQLAFLGIGEIIGIDDDKVDLGNRYSGVGFGSKDCASGLLKTDVLWRTVKAIDPAVRYLKVAARVPEKQALDALKCADVIVGCVNNLHARADIQEIAQRYVIPYVDIGLTLTSGGTHSTDGGRIRSISGNVFTSIPGGPCLWCSDFLTEEKLARETKQRGRPYLENEQNWDALVLSFNGVLASQAVNEVLQLLLGFAGEGSLSPYKKYDGLSGQLQGWQVSRNPRCPSCAAVLAAGDPLWKPVRNS
jgi:molybdopterin/thiamine biosynthesis adenylyltransferase